MKTIKGMSVSIISVLCGMSMTAMAAGNTATDFSTTINVHSDNECSVSITPPSSLTFAAHWTGSVASDTSSMVNETTDTSPHYIRVVSQGGASCNLNNVEITGSVSGSAYTLPAEPSVAIVPFGNNGGEWGIAPVVAGFKAYTDTDGNTESSASIQLIYSMSSQPSVRAQVSKTPNYTAGSSSPIMADAYGRSSYMYATDMYTDATGPRLLSAVTFTTDNAAESYKSLDVGVGAMFVKNPWGPDHKKNINVAANGDSATLPFTVTISQA